MAWSTPKSWTTGYKVLASDLNTFLSDNDSALRAGGIAIASQAANDVLFASSSTQLSRSSGLAFNDSTDALTVGGYLVTNAVGAASNDYTRLLLDGAFTSGGASTALFGTHMSGALTGHSADSAALVGTKLDNSIVTAGNCTTVAQLWVSEPQITVGSGTVTTSASLYIESAASEATSDYALLIASGATKLNALEATQVDILAAGPLRLQDTTGGQYVGLDAPGTVSASYTLTLPAAIGSVDQVLTINNVDGTLQWATPSSFNPDGAQVFNESGAAVDFRIEADGEANMFFLDGSADRIGIATSTPGAALDIAHGTGAFPADSGDTATNTALRIGNTGSNNTVLDMGANSATNTSWIQSRNRGNLTPGGSYAYPILLNPNGGKVGVGVHAAAPDELFHVKEGDAASAAAVDANCHAVFESDGAFFVSTQTPASVSAGFVFCTPNHALDGGMVYTHNTTATSSTLVLSAGHENALTCYGSTNVAVAGSLSKGSGSFNIAHPLMPDTHRLVHSFAESNETLLIHRGTVDLVDGYAQIDLDVATGMSSGTWIALCRDEQVYTSNESAWAAVRGSVTGSTLTIDCEESDCTDTVAWTVFSNRHDEHILATDWTDEQGYPITEPLIPEEPEPEPEPSDG